MIFRLFILNLQGTSPERGGYKMSKKGSALMQVLVIGLVIAAFAVMILRYAITRSANLSRSDRILQSQMISDSCMDQYMAYQATAELYGQPWSTGTFVCYYYSADDMNTLKEINIDSTNDQGITKDTDGSKMIAVTFKVPVRPGQ